MDILKDQLKPLSFNIPLSDDESRRLDTFLQQRGIKKGFFVREAILKELDRREAQERQQKDIVG